ncbi:amino acid adenylation domain-containing protein [Microcoleus sp. FACHB-SPT15]|uniref:non-ribosomal peptide synthetase n=1 Tax=Microcoleus sp. FACHB-SPT15 TaxID=2692830 RepID=UPI0017814886|nr:non-ribosomal peptide synthetase [Microcoleus sp. FACHB-SPT15]MBD1806823.1 amino acid adenylation domain-containing protein [Microcoleus sp. FACHB-SPT15]
MKNEVIEGYRLSPQQKHLWSLQQFDSTLPYRAQCALLIQGNLDPKRLELALQNVVNRHEILRTTFRCLPGMTIPLQVISDSSTLSIHYHELRGLDTQEQEVKSESLFNEVLKLPLALEDEISLYASLVILSPLKHYLILGLSALCADTATLLNLVNEVINSYAANHEDGQLSDELTQYVDIAEWQNEVLESEDTKLGVEFWQKQNIDSAFCLKLPFENTVNEIKDFQPKFLNFRVDQDLVSKIEGLAEKYNSSTAVFLLACWQILLWRITGQQTIIVGRAFNGRKYEELEQTLGLLAKSLPITGHLDRELKFSEILKHTDDSVSEGYKWQEYFDWDKVLNSTENNQKPAFFPFSFEFSEQPQIYCINELSFSVSKQYVCFDRFKVKLSCLRQNDSLITEFHYDSALFDVETIERLASQFQTLLESAINHPEVEIGKLEILKPSDRKQLLVEFNQTHADYPLDRCIHQLFEEQAERTPDSVAVVFEDQQLTYAELNKRSNQLAHHLERLGVQPEVLVGLLVERSLDLIIGLLGILKAGGAYVPLDPALPKESLAFRLQDAGVSVLLTQQLLAEKLCDRTAQVICLDTNWEVINQESQENPTSDVQPENLVYVLFTSGSTGKPKGVAVEHRQLVNYVNAIAETLDLSTCTSFATVSTFAADLGNTTIFSSLCSGGCLHVVSSERASNPEALADYFQRHPVDCLKIVPSHLTALLTSSNPKRILPRQRLILGGEACSWTLIEQIQQLTPHCQIFNHYGPTETTVGVLTYPITNNPSATSILKGGKGGSKFAATVPIGRPIANTQIYLLDSDEQPVPIGVPGELHIGGAGVARGYLNRPELTAEKFINNPFLESDELEENSSIQSSKLKTQISYLYKTGDLARYLPDGNIEFLGRIDHQVKIHGFRIELGEIEAALRQYPAVSETVVIAREDEPGRKHLVAYIVPNEQPKNSTSTIQNLKSSELRGFLQEKLPEYMVPSAFVRLKALPLTSNGKVDRQALPAPDMARSNLEETFVAPRTTVEKILAEIWTQILQLEKVGIHDNFFELGGDSILSMQIIAKANQAGLQLTPKQLFEHQTIAELAAVAGTNRTIQAEQGIVTGSVPLTPIQHWFFEQNLPDSHHWNQAVLLEVQQAIAPVLLEQAVHKLLEHHDALRLRFVHQEGNWQQVNANPDEIVPFTCIDLSTVSETEQESAISDAAAELQTNLNLSSGPLVRVALFDLGVSKPSRLLIIIHHLAVDGVSWRILLEDLQTAYQQLSQGEAIQLPPKTTSFKHWAERLQEYAQSAALQQELNYWLAESLQQIVHLPTDFPEGNNTVAEAFTVSVTLSREETQALLQAVPAAYQTQINEVLLAALMQAFAQWTGERSLLVDLEGHGREAIFDDVDLSRTVGWFTTIFPVLLDIEEASSLGDSLKAVKEQLRRIPNRGIGYGVLQYLSKSLLHSPKAEIRFNYLGQSDQIFQDSSLFKPAQESSGTGRSLRGNRSYLLDINGIVAEGQLRLDWTYSKAIHRQATIERLAESFIEALRELINCCQSLEAKGYADLPESSTPTGKVTVAALNAEAVLDPSIRPETSFEPTTETSHIFLTGATGFVGAFLLYELLQQTEADIYCLVRSPNAELGKKRLQSSLESYLLWDESLSHRIIPVVGDLSQPLLGLSEEQFQVMAGKLDVIYHNAASINLVHPYSTLKAANVLGTQEVLRLASRIKVKPVHYISTLSVLTSASHAEVKGIQELYCFNHSQVPSGGYGQTKWVAEKLVATASDRGLPVSIYRLGRVSGHSQTGICNTNDRLYRMLKGFIELGFAPDVDTTVDMTPVDYVSKAIAHLSKQEQSFGKIFHLSNPHSIRSFELFNWIGKFGYPIQLMSHNRWQAEFLNAAERFSDNPLYPLIPFFAGMGSDRTSTQDSLEETAGSAALKFNCQNTTEGLTNTSIVCPSVNAELLRTYFSYLIQSGFLNAPHTINMPC